MRRKRAVQRWTFIRGGLGLEAYRGRIPCDLSEPDRLCTRRKGRIPLDNLYNIISVSNPFHDIMCICDCNLQTHPGKITKKNDERVYIG